MKNIEPQTTMGRGGGRGRRRRARGRRWNWWAWVGWAGLLPYTSRPEPVERNTTANEPQTDRPSLPAPARPRCWVCGRDHPTGLHQVQAELKQDDYVKATATANSRSLPSALSAVTASPAQTNPTENPVPANPAVIQRVAIVDPARCTACGQCVNVCPSQAITVGEVAVVDTTWCAGCGRCAAECPQEAIRLEAVTGAPPSSVPEIQP